ncbi:hypothetical protein B0T09DRAFT_146213 [Sordaria sp. MPI-SDFR-AT-0083]|nr:hypothetical protein B0T09DRAFT_146213 [Sordaria sp. MPI-SDFR-AT-0083]
MALPGPQTSHHMNNQLAGQPERRGPGRPRRIPVRPPSQPVPIAPRPEAHHQDNARLEDQRAQSHLPTEQSHSENTGPTAQITLANTFSASASTGYAPQENPMPSSLICVGTREQHLGTLFFYLSPPEYKTDISIHGGNRSLELPGMALVSRHWPDECFISAQWLQTLELQAGLLPDHETRLVDTPQGIMVALRQVTMWFSLPQLHYGLPMVPVRATVLEHIGTGVTAIFGGSWVDIIFHMGNWKSGGASAMGFIPSCGGL